MLRSANFRTVLTEKPNPVSKLLSKFMQTEQEQPQLTNEENAHVTYAEVLGI